MRLGAGRGQRRHAEDLHDMCCCSLSQRPLEETVAEAHHNSMGFVSICIAPSVVLLYSNHNDFEAKGMFDCPCIIGTTEWPKIDNTQGLRVHRLLCHSNAPHREPAAGQGALQSDSALYSGGSGLI